MTSPIANVEMAAAWDGEEGDDWARDWQRYDRAVVGYHAALLEAAQVARGDRVLDVGSGTGETTRDAARAAPDGDALGVDLSSRMIERARELATQQGVGNARFAVADAQVHPFDPGACDVALSRFGTMFFADPAAAFANVRAALRPGGRLVMVGWRPLRDNDWISCVRAALAVGRDLPAPPDGHAGPFGLADPEQTRAALVEAGFEAIAVTPVDAPFWLGTDGDDAFVFMRGTGIVRGMTAGLDASDRARALDALHATMADHDTGGAVVLGSGAWLYSALSPPARHRRGG